jgi:hypothetical protein
MKRLMAAMAVSGALALAGCEGDNNHDDHDPPPGKGSIIVDNHTADDLAVYVDGQRVADVDDYDDKALDFKPAVHRVVLDQRGGTGNWRGDVDVVEGRRTILDITIRPGDSEYDVEIFFD